MHGREMLTKINELNQYLFTSRKGENFMCKHKTLISDCENLILHWYSLPLKRLGNLTRCQKITSKRKNLETIQEV